MDNTALIGMLGSAIAALFGALMVLVRMILARYEKLIDQDRSKQTDSLQAVAHSLENVLGLLTANATGLREVREQVTNHITRIVAQLDRIERNTERGHRYDEGR